MKIQETIKRLREEKRFSQYDMADKLGISQSTYLQIERGKTELTVNRLFQIAEILNVSALSLLGEEEKHKEELEYLRAEKEKFDQLLRDISPIISFIAKNFNKQKNTDEKTATAKLSDETKEKISESIGKIKWSDL